MQELGKQVGRAADTERARRLFASAPARQVRNDHVPTRRENAGQRHEVSPRDPEAVQQQHRLARPSLANVHPQPEHLDEAGSEHGAAQRTAERRRGSSCAGSGGGGGEAGNVASPPGLCALTSSGGNGTLLMT